MHYVDNNDLSDPEEVKNNAKFENRKLEAYTKLKNKTIQEIPYFKLILEMASEQLRLADDLAPDTETKAEIDRLKDDIARS